MRSKALRTFMLLGVITISSLCFSQTAVQATSPTSAPASTGPSKIAFVNIQEAVVTCNEGKQESAALQQRFAAKTNALKAQDDELKKLKDDYQAQNAKLTEDERNNRLKVIQDKQKAFDRTYQDFQTETQEAQQEAMNRIGRKMIPVMEKFLISNGYTALFDVSNQQTPVLWATPDSVITKRLVEAYNAQMATAPPAAPATPSAPPPKKP